eukprot:scaffold16189_cov125-Cylindrotheca_fusiformis.AAC.7
MSKASRMYRHAQRFGAFNPHCKNRKLQFHNSFRYSSTLLKPWPRSVYECNGDYRNETFLEEHIGGPLYDEQKQLPRLPIPSIADTIERFLPTALPLARTAEERKALEAACETFPAEAKVLQDRLKDRQQNEMRESSWLQSWWNQLGYLQVRDPVVYNVSYFFHFKDDPTIDTVSQNVQRATAALFATAEFRKKVCSGQLPPEKIGKNKTQLCSTAYKYMFNACRIPGEGQDSYRIYDPSRCTHAVVARKGHFFSIKFVDDSGESVPLNAIERQLEECIALAEAIPSSRPKLGLLTSLNRDDWAVAREKLCESGGPKMEEALDMIQSAAIVVNLDDARPISKQDCGELFLSGGVQCGDNRWFDKSINIMVAENGKTAVLGEHSMMDGMPLVNYADHVTKVTYADVKSRFGDGLDHVPDVIDIFAEAIAAIDNSTIDEITRKAGKEFKRCVDRQSNTALSFHGYGSEFMKASGHSPDAFVQAVIQLATFRLFGEQVGTYEATQVRPFLHGRTETTRSVSLESEAFIKTMGPVPKWDEDDSTTRRNKLDLFRKSTAAHSQYTRIAAEAKGIDRHFFGLSMLLETDEMIPRLFEDPIFNYSKRWRVSTSHLTHPNFVNWGFGQVVPDGVGIAYSIHPRSCVFNISALAETNWTQQLNELLEEALLEMRRVIEAESFTDSKL